MPKLDDLEILQEKIDEAKIHTAHPNHPEPGPNAAAGQAIQVATSFIAGAAVGSAIGYFIDRWLGTSPIGLLIGFLLGFAGGVYSLVRRAGNK